MGRRSLVAAAIAALLLSCQGTAPESPVIEIMTSFQGSELNSFRHVLDAFQQQTHISYRMTPNVSRDVDEPLGNRLADPPDVVILPQPGEVGLLVRRHDAVAPLAPATQAAVRASFDPLWRQAGTVDGQMYGVVFKGSDKSVLWYRPDALRKAGIASPPQSWDQFLDATHKLAAAGEPPVVVAGADGWTLTDWFENILLDQSGPAVYDQLARHEITWTSEPVRRALATLARLWGDPRLMDGGMQGALQTTYDQSIATFAGATPSPGFLYEASFVESGLASRGAQAHRDYDLAPFPEPDPAPGPVIIGGDVAITMRHASHQDASQALLRYLSSPEAALRWIESSDGAGYLSPNRQVSPSVYPGTGLTATVAQHIRSASVVRFDMSDTLPPDFGARDEWTDMQGFLAHPDAIGATTQELENHASADLGSGGEPAELPRCPGC